MILSRVKSELFANRECDKFKQYHIRLLMVSYLQSWSRRVIASTH